MPFVGPITGKCVKSEESVFSPIFVARASLKIVKVLIVWEDCRTNSRVVVCITEELPEVVINVRTRHPSLVLTGFSAGSLAGHATIL